MPRPLHRGRPGSAVIPGEWQQQLAPVVANVLATSGCTIRITPRGAQPGWNATSGQTETTAAADVYAGAASITVVSNTDRDLTVVDDTITSRLYEIRLPWDAPAAADTRGQLVTVVSDPDPDLTGRTLTVQAAERDTRRFSRLLYATLTD